MIQFLLHRLYKAGGKKMKKKKWIVSVMGALLWSFLMTGMLLAAAAFLLWKTDLSQNMQKIIVLILYVLSAGTGGFAVGKMQKERKFLWGLLVGVLYFLILLLTHGIFGGLSGIFWKNAVTVAVICSMSGTLGGMLA